MDENLAIMELKFDRTKCCLCEADRSSSHTLFKFPSDENRYKQWFSALKWNVPPEKVSYALYNARICDGHFPESCFTNTLRNRLQKFACPDLRKGEPVVHDITPPVLSPEEPVSASVVDNEPSCSRNVSSPTSLPHDTSSYLKVTPKTKKLRSLLSSVSKLKKRLYEKRASTPFLGQLKAKFADKPHLYNFVTSQIRNVRCRNNKGRRWSAKEKSFALEIYLHSPSAYKILRKYFAFPSKSTLQRYTFNVAKTSGFCPNLMKCLRAQACRMKNIDKLCVLTFDEMAIKEGLAYAADLDSVDGFTTVKNHYNQKPPLATQALVFMARGIVKNWKQVLGYYFTSRQDEFCLEKLVRKAIAILQSCGLEVVSIVCDQGPTNQRLFKELKVTRDSPFFFHNSKKIYAMYDPPHLLKSVRNIIKNHGIHFEDKIVGDVPQSCFASWQHIEKLYEMDSKNKFSACRKLTKQHIEVSGLKKMNVKLAAQVLSHSVASALNLYVSAGNLESKAVETAEFIWKMDKLFDSVNSRSLKHEKKEMCAVTNNSFHIEFWKAMINWISKWNIRSRKNNRKIVPACKNGWIITLKAFIEISQNLLKETKFVLTNHFNQDPLENTFSTVRRRGGFRDTPNAFEFRHTIHKVIITNILKQSSNKNCLDDNTNNLVDFSSMDKKEISDVKKYSFEDSDEENQQDDLENLTTLNNIEQNVLTYIAGYLAKKILSSKECVECKKLLIDDKKCLDVHTIFLYFKEYDSCKSGLKWPTKDLLMYFMDLFACFSSNFNIFFQRVAVSQNFITALDEVNIDIFNNHLEHKNEAKSFFISTFVRMMIKHNVKLINDELKCNTMSKKKLKFG